MNLPAELKTHIENHLKIVQQHLDERSLDEQHEILQSLETQIHNALKARSHEPPTLELINEIIAEMDAPASYGPATPLVAPAQRAPLSPGKKLGFILLLAALFCMFAYVWLTDSFSSHWMEPPSEPHAETAPANTPQQQNHQHAP